MLPKRQVRSQTAKRRTAARTFPKGNSAWSDQRQDSDPCATFKRNLNTPTQADLPEARQTCLENISYKKWMEEMCTPEQTKETRALGKSRRDRGCGAGENGARRKSIPSPHSATLNESAPYAPLPASVFSTALINTRHTTAGSQVLTTSPKMVCQLLENSCFIYCCNPVVQDRA